MHLFPSHNPIDGPTHLKFRPICVVKASSHIDSKLWFQMKNVEKPDELCYQKQCLHV